MNNETIHQNRIPWRTPELTTLSISRDTQQNGPIDPPDVQQQDS